MATMPATSAEANERASTGSSRLLLAAGLLTWAMLAVPFVARAIEDPAWRTWNTWIWAVAHGVFGALLILSFRAHRNLGWAAAAPIHRSLLVGQTLAALVAIGITQHNLLMILLVIIASQVPLSSGLALSLGWVAGQTALGVPLAFADNSLGRAVVEGGTQVGFQLFAVYAATAAVRERNARAMLEHTHAELLSTRALLAESSRVAERRRISRELHDLLGHHLTALSLRLEAATHRRGEERGEEIQAARTIASGLLDDVRDVVRTFREDQNLDIAGPLRTLAEAIREPAVHLEMPTPLEIEDPARANTVLRAAQEMVTNAARHARARNVWIHLERDDDRVSLDCRDDGRGAREPRFGTGLTGMRERLEELGGSLSVDTAPGRGFRVVAELPLNEVTT